MIDPDVRRVVARLVSEFRDGQLANDAFHAETGKYVGSADRAIRAVESMLWTMSDHSRTHDLTGPDALTAAARALFDRCVQFLETDLEYEWPEDRFDRTSGTAASLHVLTFGLTWLYTRWKERRNQSFYEGLQAAGDFDVWPFLRRSDYDAHSRERTRV